MIQLKITRERFDVVYNDISEGSEPALRFYLLVAISTLIASFGLISNSTAVVIGAMLVAPLMTPIFGISLALVRGDTGLLGRAARAEVVGVVAAVFMGFLLGLVIGEFDPTTEMLSRTRPNLFDLLVAVLAGFAGAYALVDEKISPALPGVAIATAIVPPLANSGLCFALGETRGGTGSFLLFFANFLSILVVASITFYWSGMAKRYGAQETNINLVRRFGLPLLLFVFITIFLGHSLFQIAEERRIEKTIRTTLIKTLSTIPASYLKTVHHYKNEGKIHVMAGIHSPTILSPNQVTSIQDRLTEKIGEPAELVMHISIGNNVSAMGSVKNVVTPQLDGTFTKSSDNEIINSIATAEQIIREYIGTDPALDLIRVELLRTSQQRIMMAHLLGIRQLKPEEIALLEARIRKALEDDALSLAVSSFQKTLQNRQGTMRYGWILGNNATPETRQRIRQIRLDLKAFFNSEQRFDLVNMNATRLDEKLQFLLEIVGPNIYPREKIEMLQADLIKKYEEPIVLYARSRIEVVHGPQGPVQLNQLLQSFSDRQKENIPEEVSLILESSNK
jgi:uncharacterized hydrophobic protein (TIGR00271 family)